MSPLLFLRNHDKSLSVSRIYNGFINYLRIHFEKIFFWRTHYWFIIFFLQIQLTLYFGIILRIHICSRIYNEFTIFSENSLWNYYFFMNSLWIYYLFFALTMISLPISENNEISLYNQWIYHEFTISIVKSQWFYYQIASLLWIQYLSRG